MTLISIHIYVYIKPSISAIGGQRTCAPRRATGGGHFKGQTVVARLWRKIFNSVRLKYRIVWRGHDKTLWRANDVYFSSGATRVIFFVRTIFFCLPFPGYNTFCPENRHKSVKADRRYSSTARSKWRFYCNIIIACLFIRLVHWMRLKSNEINTCNNIISRVGITRGV